jgi:hypothetical protein
MTVTKFSILFLSMSFMLLLVLQCSGQTSGLKITVDQYNWTNDMKETIGITTPYIGLILNVTISNQGSEPIDMASDYATYNTIWIGVIVSSTDKGNYYTFQKTIAINDLYLPVNGSDTRYLQVEPYDLQTTGNYVATLTWSYGSIGTVPYTVEGQQVEGSPFNFKVLDNDTFQQQLQLRKAAGGTTINIYIPIAIFGGGGSIVVFSIYEVTVYLRKRKGTDRNTDRINRRRKPKKVQKNC